MVYQDHLAEFIELRALKTKRAEDVAYQLLHVITIFGAQFTFKVTTTETLAVKLLKKCLERIMLLFQFMKY